MESGKALIGTAAAKVGKYSTGEKVDAPKFRDHMSEGNISAIEIWADLDDCCGSLLEAA